MKKIPLIKPYITEEVKAKVCQVLDSGFLTEGSVTREFESAVEDYIGCKHALAVTSCTTGLELALRSLGVAPGDEVIVPDYTYPATADVVAILGARIVLVDICKENMLLDCDRLEEAITEHTKVIMPVSIFGNPLDYDRLSAIKRRYGVYIVEDAACSLGAEYKGTKVGNLADISVFSFHPRKFLTTGEGGIVTTNNTAWADWMRSYKQFGVAVHPSNSMPIFERVGTNYKLSNILAAIGLVQMEHMDELLNQRNTLAENYTTLLLDQEKIMIPETTEHGKHSHQSFCVYVRDRDQVMKKMRSAGIEVQIGTYALHMQPAFTPSHGCQVRGDMAGSRYAFENSLVLPLYHDLRASEQEYIVGKLLQIVS